MSMHVDARRFDSSEAILIRRMAFDLNRSGSQLQYVPELLFLRPQVFEIIRIRCDLEGQSLHDLDTITTDTRALDWIIRQDPNLPDPEISENLGPDTVVTKVGTETQSMIGLHRVEAFAILEFIGPDLITQHMPATFTGVRWGSSSRG